MKNKILIVLFFCLLIIACKKEKSEQAIIITNLPKFDKIELNDFFDVFIIEDSSYQIEIRGSKELISHLDYQVINNELVIKNNKKLKWSDPQNNLITLYISSMGLKEINANETCNIKSINPITTHEFGIILKSKANVADLLFDNEIVYYWNNFPCGGKLTLSGKTNELKLWNTALMSVDASLLECQKALVENSSKGNCTVNVSQQLKYSIEGEGDIIVLGNPNQIILEQKSSSGKLILP
jgi:hypothetical protein